MKFNICPSHSKGLKTYANIKLNFFHQTVTINGALALKSLQACNGLIYVIDKVLNPADLMPENDEMEIFERYGLTTVKRILDVLGAIPSVNIFCE
jgi:hypothetical protein